MLDKAWFGQIIIRSHGFQVLTQAVDETLHLVCEHLVRHLVSFIIIFLSNSNEKVTFGKKTYKNWKTYWLLRDSLSSSKTASTYSRKPCESTSKAMLAFRVLLSMFLGINKEFLKVKKNKLIFGVT